MQVQETKEFQNNRLPLTLDQETPVNEVIRRMAEGGHSAAIALRDEYYDGLFTERLLLKDIADGRRFDNLRLRDVARHDAPTATLEEDAQVAINTLNRSPYRHMPIIDKDNRFRGLLSQADFASYTWSQALSRASESAQIGVTSAYQPFVILGASLVYTLFVIYLVAAILSAGSLPFTG